MTSKQRLALALDYIQVLEQQIVFLESTIKTIQLQKNLNEQTQNVQTKIKGYEIDGFEFDYQKFDLKKKKE